MISNMLRRMSNAPERTRVPRPNEQAEDTLLNQDSERKGTDGPTHDAKIQSKQDNEPVAPLVFNMGEVVFVVDTRDGKWKEGQIVGMKRGNKYDVCLSDDYEEVNVNASHMSKFAPTPRVGETSQNSEPKKIDAPAGVAPSDAKDNKPSTHGTVYAKGQAVEVQSHETGQYRRAIISVAHVDGQLYDVIYQDRTKELNVPEAVIRPWSGGAHLNGAPKDKKADKGVVPPAPRDASPSNALVVAHALSVAADHAALVDGTLVEARLEGGSKWVEGKIRKARKNGTFDIDYDNGEREVKVSAEFVRLRAASQPVHVRKKATNSTDIVLGSLVIADNHEEGTWLSGLIVKAHDNDTFDIVYEDEESEDNVKKECIRLLCYASSTVPFAETALDVGAKVLGNFKLKNAWYPGVIAAMNGDGTWEVHYDDGAREKAVDAFNLRRLDAIPHREVDDHTTVEPPPVAVTSPTDSVSKHSHAHKEPRADMSGVKVGDIAEARHHHKWIPVRIEAINGNDTFDVTPLVGKTQKLHPGIPGSHLRPKESAPVETSAGALATSEQAESTSSQPEEKISLQAASQVVSAPDAVVSSTPSKRNAKAFQRSAAEKEADAELPLFQPGATVEANYGSTGEWIEGVILRNFGNGFHYEVEVSLPDGSTARSKMKRQFIRAKREDVDGAGESLSAASFGLVDNTPPTPRNTLAAVVPVGKLSARTIGSCVEANFRSEGRWLPARIQSVNRDLTYDLLYDNGNEEEGVVMELMRDIVHPEESAVEDNVARNPVVAAAAMALEEGSKTIAVKTSEVIRASAPNPTHTSVQPKAPENEYTVGERVECNCEGKGHWVVCKLERIRDDGTFDVDYENGHRETRVISAHLRRPRPILPRQSSVPRREAPLMRRESSLNHATVYTENTRVEGNYRSQGKWKAGYIASVKLDGTYIIFYDDGDYEDAVRPISIRSLSAKQTAPQASSSAPPVSALSIPPTEASDSAPSGLSPQNPSTPGKSFSSPVKGGRSYRVAGSATAAEPSRSKVEFREPIEEVKIIAKYESQTALQPEASPQPVSPRHPTEANYHNKNIWLAVQLITERKDGLVDVVYGDGEIEAGLSAERIRLVQPPAATPPVVTAVEVNYHGKGTWLPAKVLREVNGLMDVVYDDGEVENKVHPHLLRPVMKDEQKKSGEIRVGDRVSANYRQTGVWYTAAVTNVRADGTFDVLYDSGEFEIRVAAACVQPLVSPALNARRSLNTSEAVPPVRASNARPQSAGPLRRPYNGVAGSDYEVSQSATKSELNTLREILAKNENSTSSGGRRVSAAAVGALRTPQNSLRWLGEDSTEDLPVYEDVLSETPSFRGHRGTLDISRSGNAHMVPDPVVARQKELLVAKEEELHTLSAEVQDLRVDNAELQEGMLLYRNRCASLNDEVSQMREREENLLKQLKAQGQQLARLMQQQT